MHRLGAVGADGPNRECDSGPRCTQAAVGSQIGELLHEIDFVLIAKAPRIQAEQGSVEAVSAGHVKPCPGGGWSG